jgi:hypothetical protein
MGHKHADKMRMYAEDAAKHEKPWELWEYSFFNGLGWQSMGKHPVWACNTNYRRKPETVTLVVNGREFCLPKWETKAHEEGQEYYSMSGCMEKGYDHFVWNNDCFDKTLLQNKLVQLSEEHVIEWVKLWKFMTGGGE